MTGWRGKDCNTRAHHEPLLGPGMLRPEGGGRAPVGPTLQAPPANLTHLPFDRASHLLGTVCQRCMRGSGEVSMHLQPVHREAMRAFGYVPGREMKATAEFIERQYHTRSATHVSPHALLLCSPLAPPPLATVLRASTDLDAMRTIGTFAAPVCGDGKCERQSGESCDSCPADCGECGIGGSERIVVAGVRGGPDGAGGQPAPEHLAGRRIQVQPKRLLYDNEESWRAGTGLKVRMHHSPSLSLSLPLTGVRRPARGGGDW